MLEVTEEDTEHALVNPCIRRKLQPSKSNMRRLYIVFDTGFHKILRLAGVTAKYHRRCEGLVMIASGCIAHVNANTYEWC